MIFTAFDESSYRSGPYRICWTVRGYDVWNMDKPKGACLARELTISEAMALCETDLVEFKAMKEGK